MKTTCSGRWGLLGPVSLACLFGPTVPALAWNEVARSETGHSRWGLLGPVSLACLFGPTVPALAWNEVARSETGHSGSVGDRP